MELPVASSGVNSLALRFRRAADGSLVAKVSESSNGLIPAIPFHMSSLHYLRWGVWTEDPRANPATVEPDRVPADTKESAEPPGSP